MAVTHISGNGNVFGVLGAYDATEVFVGTLDDGTKMVVSQIGVTDLSGTFLTTNSGLVVINTLANVKAFIASGPNQAVYQSGTTTLVSGLPVYQSGSISAAAPIGSNTFDGGSGSFTILAFGA